MSTIKVTNLSGRGGASPNLPDGAVISGVVTATSFSGSGANLTGVANTDFVVGTAITMATGNIGNVNLTKSAGGVGATVGSYTGVTTYYGDGSSLSGVGETTTIWDFNPDVNDTDVGDETGIGFTFSTKIIGGSGSATLKVVNAGVAGTTEQTWGISSATFATSVLTFGALVNPLTSGATYQFDIPDGFLTKPDGTAYAGTAYTFSIAGGSKGRLFSWGYDGIGGQLGQNRGGDRSSPIQVGSTSNWNSTGRNQNSSGSYLSSAIKSNNQFWTWGDNEYGNLGLNDNLSRSSPVQVTGGWSLASQNDHMSYGVKTDGTLWVWGRNHKGQYGLNNLTQYSSPIQVPGTWSTIRKHNHHSGDALIAIKPDGTLWAWGDNETGKLGHNNGTDYSSPVQIPGTTWDNVVTSTHQTAAIKTDGTLWAWGNGGSGGLGQNNTTNYSSPVQIPGTTWANVYNTAGVTFHATKTDGTLWAWGGNDSGVLGQNDGSTAAKRSSPVQIPGTAWSTTHDDLTGGYTSNFGAIKTDGTLWVWGYGGYGVLGQSATANYSSPIQIPGTWYNLGAFSYGMRGIKE